ncbi:UPF0758 domain-containing protein [Polynucleobacter necessarius]|uniref:UPF0758 domain-containing protein n=1 Tax=Polynucleobacter necessarius TaxID=576610 RepID=UPI002F947B20
MHSPITHWPKNEQPREKLRLKGAAALSDAELLAIFLCGSGSKEKVLQPSPRTCFITLEVSPGS